MTEQESSNMRNQTPAPNQATTNPAQTLIDRLTTYMVERYGVLVEKPWRQYPENITYKAPDNAKWIAIVMPYDGTYIMNVKADYEFIVQISQVPGYMPGYHMNKQHWLSIYLDGRVPYEQILDCIDTSYEIVTDSPTKRIYEAVKRIPEGCVATYGQVAAMAGDPKMARAVGNALHKNPDPSTIPCHRVVNAAGELADAFVFGGVHVQAERLTAEGVQVLPASGKRKMHVDLSCYGMRESGRFGWTDTRKDDMFKQTRAF